MIKFFFLFSTLLTSSGCMLNVRVSDLNSLSKNITVDTDQSELKFTQNGSSAVRITGTCSGVSTVKVTAPGIIEAETACTNSQWSLDLDLSSTADGPIQMDFFADQETTPKSSLTVTKDSQITSPQYHSFTSTGGNYSDQSQPIIRLTSLEVDSDVNIYKDAGCTQLVGNKKATASEDGISLTFTTFGRYSLYTKATDALGNTTSCVNLNAAYYYAKKFDITITTDPNNNDQTLDGICADSTGKCSIKAALDETIGTFSSVPVLLNFEPGLYNYTVSRAGSYNYLKMVGNGATTTEIRGNSTTQFLLATGFLMVLEDLAFNQYNGGGFDIFTNTGFLEYKISRVHFKNNLAGTYGVISGRNGFEVTHSLFENNTSGSALYSRNSMGSIKFTTFLSNASTAIQLRGSSQVSIENSLIYGSTTGILVNGAPKTDIYNSIIAGNISAGISSAPDSNEMALNIYNTTMIDNGAAANGNLNIVGNNNPYNFAIKIYNSVLAINGSKANCNTLSGNYTITFANTLLDEGTCPNVGTSLIAPPLLGATTLQGIVLNVMPQTGSPLIDAGNNGTCLSTDYRGLLRPIQKVLATPTCDIGAIEVQATD